LYRTGQMEERTIGNFKKIAIEEDKKESWYLSYISSDRTEKEKSRGNSMDKTYFNTESKAFAILKFQEILASFLI
jgi:translation elongation factor EF-1alpha